MQQIIEGIEEIAYGNLTRAQMIAKLSTLNAYVKTMKNRKNL